MKTLEVYFLLFIVYSVIGWVLEVVYCLIGDHYLVNRGFLIGPYCPIYGVSAVMMILLLSKINNYLLLFLVAMVLCSACEYFTSYILEKIFHARWWDYSSLKFNINGRICLKNSILFGLLGVGLIKYVNPFINKFIMLMNKNTLFILFISILIIFIVDLFVSCSVLFKLKNLSIKYKFADNTREITKHIREMLKNNFFVKRLFDSFPKLRESMSIKFKSLIKK